MKRVMYIVYWGVTATAIALIVLVTMQGWLKYRQSVFHVSAAEVPYIEWRTDTNSAPNPYLTVSADRKTITLHRALPPNETVLCAEESDGTETCAPIADWRVIPRKPHK